MPVGAASAAVSLSHDDSKDSDFKYLNQYLPLQPTGTECAQTSPMNPLPSVLSTEKLSPALDARRPSETDAAPARRPLLGSSAAFLGALSILLWAYWPTLAEVARKWSDPQYSKGYLLRPFAIALLFYLPLPSDQVSSPFVVFRGTLREGFLEKFAAFHPAAWGPGLLARVPTGPL